MQWAALDAIVFLSGDSSLVRGISQELIALALKFLGPNAAKTLRELAWTLLEQMVKVDPDLFWMYVPGFSLNFLGSRLSLLLCRSSERPEA